MVFGLGFALAGLLYFGIGALQTQVGVGTALSIAFVSPIVSAILSVLVLRRAPAVPPATLVETLCACAAASGTGIVTCAPACTLSCNGASRNA